MGQSVNSQVMALQTQLVLLGVGGCCGTEAGILGAASSGKLGSLLEKQNRAEPSAVACPV